MPAKKPPPANTNPGRAVKAKRAGGGAADTAGRDAAQAVAAKRLEERRALFHQTTVRLHREVTGQIGAWLADRPGETFTSMVLHALRETYGLQVLADHFPSKNYRRPRFKG